MKPNDLYAEADRLYLEQQEARGWRKGKTLDGKPCRLPNPYEPTPENEARASKILALRRQAARLEHD